MNTFTRRLPALMLTALLSLYLVLPATATTNADIRQIAADTAMVLQDIVEAPQFGSIGGEWLILALARGGFDVPQAYFENYYEGIVALVKEKKGQISSNKYTDYARLILTLTALGKDPNEVGGYSLLTPLGDYDKTLRQGINGPIWALLALDCGNYAMPENPEAKTQATREAYLERILSLQREDGGWALNSAAQTADPDVSAMALQALAKYRSQPKVQVAIDRALTCLSQMQDKTGGFSSFGGPNAESCAQVILALCELGISDARFVKEENNPLDALLSYYEKGKGFVHMAGGDGSYLMASEQALCALVALLRVEDGKTSFYTMEETTQEDTQIEPKDTSIMESVDKWRRVATKLFPQKAMLQVENLRLLYHMLDATMAP